MGIIAEFFGFERKSVEPVTTSVDLLRAMGDARTSAGEHVNEFTALQVSSVMGCARPEPQAQRLADQFRVPRADRPTPRAPVQRLHLQEPRQRAACRALRAPAERGRGQAI